MSANRSQSSAPRRGNRRRSALSSAWAPSSHDTKPTSCIGLWQARPLWSGPGSQRAIPELLPRTHLSKDNLINRREMRGRVTGGQMTPQTTREHPEGTSTGTPTVQGRRRFWAAVAGLSAAGAVGLGVLNFLGAATGLIVNLVGVALLVGAFVGSLVKILQERFAGHRTRTKVLFVGAVLGASLLLVIVGLATRAVIPLHRMAGTQDLAVIGFHPSEAAGPAAWEGLGASVASALAKPGGGEVHDYSDEVDPPLVGLGSSGADSQLTVWAESFAAETGAELVVAGRQVGSSDETRSLRVAAYVPAQMLPDAVELSGWYVLRDIPFDSSLASTAARKEVTDDLGDQVGALGGFTNALDEWNNGHLAEAAAGFRKVLESVPDRAGTLAGLAHLFRGHALEARAATSPGGATSALIREAKAEYDAARLSSVLVRRVDLSLATNDYLEVASGGCKAEQGLLDRLEKISEELNRIADARPSDLVSLRAEANWAQVQLCRELAGERGVDRNVAPVLSRLITLKPKGGVTPRAAVQIRSVALSTQASLFAVRRQYASAVTSIRQALQLDLRFERQALWLGLESAWLLRDCRVPDGQRTQQRSLDQLNLAISRGRIPPDERSIYEKDFVRELSTATAHCATRP